MENIPKRSVWRFWPIRRYNIKTFNEDGAKYALFVLGASIDEIDYILVDSTLRISRFPRLARWGQPIEFESKEKKSAIHVEGNMERQMLHVSRFDVTRTVSDLERHHSMPHCKKKPPIWSSTQCRAKHWNSDKDKCSRGLSVSGSSRIEFHRESCPWCPIEMQVYPFTRSAVQMIFPSQRQKTGSTIENFPLRMTDQFTYHSFLFP
jgi:hypothetical protein